jgi:hypothetical protein
MRRTLKLLASFAVAATFAVGVIALYTPAQAGPCRCPLIYAPVKCSNGQTYPNSCVANCHHAKDCVPTGEIF